MLVKKRCEGLQAHISGYRVLLAVGVIALPHQSRYFTICPSFDRWPIAVLQGEADVRPTSKGAPRVDTERIESCLHITAIGGEVALYDSRRIRPDIVVTPCCQFGVHGPILGRVDRRYEILCLIGVLGHGYEQLGSSAVTGTPKEIARGLLIVSR
jgi:hypothetical protein